MEIKITKITNKIKRRSKCTALDHARRDLVGLRRGETLYQYAYGTGGGWYFRLSHGQYIWQWGGFDSSEHRYQGNIDKAANFLADITQW